VKNVCHGEGRQLSHTIQDLTAQVSLLRVENSSLKEALINKKTKRKRGKPLLLEAPEQYAGGAVFWSPTKVADARVRQAQKEAEQQAEQAAKDRKAIEKEQTKQEKARLLEERAQQKQIANKIQLQEQRKKAAEKEEAKLARELAAQLKNDLKLSKQSRPKPPLPKSRRRKPKSNDIGDTSVVVVDSTLVENTEQNLRTTRRGRKIIAPKRLQD
jgi:hypothetical protein